MNTYVHRRQVGGLEGRLVKLGIRSTNMRLNNSANNDKEVLTPKTNTISGEKAPEIPDLDTILPTPKNGTADRI